MAKNVRLPKKVASYLYFSCLVVLNSFQVLGWQLLTCQTSCLIWLLTFCGTPRAGPATPLRWLPLPGVRTWSETSPTHPITTTTCSQLMWPITTTALKNCWKPCVTFADQEVERHCCGPTRSGSSQTWGSQSALRAASTPRCSLSSHSRRWGYTRPQRRSDGGASGRGVLCLNFEEKRKFHFPPLDLNQRREKSGFDVCLRDIPGQCSNCKQKAEMKLLTQIFHFNKLFYLPFSYIWYFWLYSAFAQQFVFWK